MGKSPEEDQVVIITIRQVDKLQYITDSEVYKLLETWEAEAYLKLWGAHKCHILYK